MRRCVSVCVSRRGRNLFPSVLDRPLRHLSTLESTSCGRAGIRMAQNPPSHTSNLTCRVLPIGYGDAHASRRHPNCVRPSSLRRSVAGDYAPRLASPVCPPGTGTSGSLGATFGTRRSWQSRAKVRSLIRASREIHRSSGARRIRPRFTLGSAVANSTAPAIASSTALSGCVTNVEVAVEKIPARDSGCRGSAE